jgi:hypothetical protein
MGVVRERMQTDMQLRNFRPATQAQYLACAKELARYYRLPAAELGAEQVRGFLCSIFARRGA